MRSSRAVLAITAVSVILIGSAVFGCNGKSMTSPYGGGSTGGTGGTGGTANTPFNSGTLNAPASFVHVFPTAGTVGYHCIFHQSMGMTGDVTVVAGAGDSLVVTASGTSFAPASGSIRPGGYVHWKITGGTHTVTSD
jgi:plastocyanin